MAYKFQKGAAVLSGALDQEGTIVVKDDNGNVVASFENDGDLSGSGDFELGGTVRLDGVAQAAVTVGTDSLYFFDATDQLMKKESVSAFMVDIAGAGLAEASGQLALDIDELNALGGASVAQGDNFLVSDNGTEKKVTFSNLEDSIFGNISGDATVAAGGALTIANDAVEQAMIADDAVGADQLASDARVTHVNTVLESLTVIITIFYCAVLLCTGYMSMCFSSLCPHSCL